MVVATHLIKVKGEFTSKWDESSLREYVKNKLREIEVCLHPDLELFGIHDENQIDVWIFIHALPSEVSQNIVDKWAKDHITEEGLTVKEVGIEVVNDLTNLKPFFVHLA